MSIRQLSIFAENKPGILVEITSALADAHIDIRAMSIADTSDYGICRLIVNNIEDAKAALSGIGFIVSETYVLAAAVPDSPGALTDIMKLLADNDINVEYMYAFFTVSKKYAYVVLRVPNNEIASNILTEHGIRLISDEDIKNL